ncbi:MAG: hypothetical protein KAJ19_03215 [Gammaproteobacteria bacterium]|nr:hypothetical protein [Gammaproteobacteria bacterium]
MDTVKDIFGLVSPHWPFIFYVLVMVIAAQTLKTRVLTRELASKSKVINWMRRLFPLILLLLGVIIGVVWPGETSPGISLTVHKVLYFSGASGVAMVGFNIVKQVVKKKYDIDLGVMRETQCGQKESKK